MDTCSIVPLPCLLPVKCLPTPLLCQWGQCRPGISSDQASSIPLLLPIRNLPELCKVLVRQTCRRENSKEEQRQVTEKINITDK